MSKREYKYRRDVEAYRSKTEGLTFVQHGAYNLLLDHYYKTRCPLTNDVDALLRMTRASTDEECAAIKYVLRRYFTLRDGAYHNERADEELQLSHTRAEAGKKGADAREANRKQTGMQNRSKARILLSLARFRRTRVCG